MQQFSNSQGYDPRSVCCACLRRDVWCLLPVDTAENRAGFQVLVMVQFKSMVRLYPK